MPPKDNNIFPTRRKAPVPVVRRLHTFKVCYLNQTRLVKLTEKQAEGVKKIIDVLENFGIEDLLFTKVSPNELELNKIDNQIAELQQRRSEILRNM